MRHALRGHRRCLAAAACGASPAAAASGTFEVGRLPGSPLASETIPSLVGPLAAGDAIAFAAGSDARGWSVRVAAPGLAARELGAYEPIKYSTLTLRASATRVVVVRHAFVCESCHDMSYRSTLDALIAGPIGGPLTPLAQCQTGQPCTPGQLLCSGDRPQFVAALGGDLLAVLDRCTQTTRVLDLASGAGRPIGGAQDTLAVAGRFVATTDRPPGLLASSTIVVRDATSGAEVYRTSMPATAVPPTQLALLPDGTVVYSAPGRGQLALVVASPDAPAGRVLRVLPYATTIAGVGAGLVALATPAAAGGLTNLATPSPVGTLALDLVALDVRPDPVQRVAVEDGVGSPSFDGRTLAWAQRACVTTVISRWQLGGARPAPVDLRCPTPRPSREAVTLPRNRRMAVALDCPATARGGCEASVRLTAVRRGRLPRGVNAAERRYRLGSVEIALDPGEHGRAPILVPVGAARWVRRHAPLRLRIDALSALAQPEQRPAGDRGSVSRTVALRAARGARERSALRAAR